MLRIPGLLPRQLVLARLGLCAMVIVLAGESGKYQGGEQALRLKQEVLSPEQLAEAQKAVQAWRPDQCESEAGLAVGLERK